MEETGAEDQNHFSQPADQSAFEAAQDTVDFLGCECTLLPHVQLFIRENPQGLLHRASLNEVFSQAALMSRIALSLKQHFALETC